MLHHVLDLETLSTRDNAMVLSMGVVAFDDDDPQFVVLSSFYTVLDTVFQSAHLGRHVDPATVEWWNSGERDTARMLAYERPVALAQAFYGFQSYVNGQTEACIWGNGADFDLPILRSLMVACGFDWPYPYKNARCMRTLKHVTAWHSCWDLKFEGVVHHALDDARHEAEMIHFALRVLRT